MSPEKVAQLRIDPQARRRPRGVVWLGFPAVLLVTAAAVVIWNPGEREPPRVMGGGRPPAAPPTNAAPSSAGAAAPAPARPAADQPPPGEVVLTVSGYIINRERIELSPRFMGQVTWIGVKKGDAVTNGQVLVLLDDAEYRAQEREVEGRIASARVGVERARIELARIESLAQANIETQRSLDLARLDVAAAEADVRTLEAQLQRIRTWLDWTVIRAPINGVVLEKLVDPNELVTPQSFGGTRGPSTALVSLGDPGDLQVEIDLNENDLAKVFLGQRCRVSPEAYLDRSYDGVVAEIAPEASRQKGTLQIKVQIKAPDRFLTPELSAKVDFLAGEAPSAGR